MRQKPAPVRCSFCHKSKSRVGKLITNPDYPRVYICEGCIRVCASILDDDAAADGRQAEARPPAPPEPPLDHAKAAELIAMLTHPTAVELVASVERWITREASGGEAAAELDQVRTAAKVMFVNQDA